MKKILFAMFSLCFLLLSCSKEGPAGKDGINGKDGVNGINGIDGKDGTIIYSGQGVPTTSLGKVGDYFMDLTNSKLYGPKTQSGWGNGFSMKGENGKDGKDGINGKDGTNGKDGVNGKDGKDGTTILSGLGLPNITLGKAGDYYLDKNSYLLYGPKTENSWGAGLLLRGKDGINGVDGKDGNANVRTYMFSNPWNYYYDEQPRTGLFRLFFGGNFYVNSFEAEYGLILGFIESTSENFSVWSQAGTTHSNYFLSNFNSSFQLAKSKGVMTGVFIKVGSNLLTNSGETDWTDKQDAINKTLISRIKIVVIPQSSLNVLGYNKNDLDSKALSKISEKYIKE